MVILLSCVCSCTHPCRKISFFPGGGANDDAAVRVCSSQCSPAGMYSRLVGAPAVCRHAIAVNACTPSVGADLKAHRPGVGKASASTADTFNSPLLLLAPPFPRSTLSPALAPQRRSRIRPGRLLRRLHRCRSGRRFPRQRQAAQRTVPPRLRAARERASRGGSTSNTRGSAWGPTTAPRARTAFSTRSP